MVLLATTPNVLIQVTQSARFGFRHQNPLLHDYCRKINIMDTMVQKLERYANNLEDIVDKRTEELIHEKKKTDQLLYRMLPA